MASKMRPASKELAPDASDTYERAHPEHEAGMGAMDTNRQAKPSEVPDQIGKAVKNRQDGTRQLNGEDLPRTHAPKPK